MRTNFRQMFLATTFLFSLMSLCVASASAQGTIHWNKPAQFDDGMQTQAAINSSGLVIEFHTSQAGYGLWYHVGRLTQYGQSVQWGPSQDIERTGSDRPQWPTVALTNDNYVILSYSDAVDRPVGRLRYRVGKLDPTGPVQQSIQWLTEDQQYDTGFHSNISVDSNGVIVEVHESDADSGLFYRIGHLENPAEEKYNIVWDTGTGGVRYDNGVNPHVSVNDRNQVVEMHQTKGGESRLHYRRGVLQSPSTIAFTNSELYSTSAYEPAVVLTNRDEVFALSQNASIYSDSGIFHAYDPSLIWWKGRTAMRDGATGRYPGLGTNGNYLIATWNRDGKLYYVTALVPLN